MKKILQILFFFLLLSQFSFAQDPWTQKADMHIARKSHSSCVLDGKIYIIGGKESAPNSTLKSIDVYDRTTDIWDNTKSDMIEARVNFPCCTYNGKILAIGGSQTMTSGPISSIEEYDPVTGKWTYKTNIQKARIGLTASLVNDKIYIFGGMDATGALIADVEVYDLITGAWTTAKNLPTPRYGLYSVELGGKIYVMGGTFGASNGYLGLKIVEMYDPETDEWSTQADMITGRKNFTACTLDDKIYVLGGAAGDCGGIMSSVEAYNPLIDSWEERTNMKLKLGGPSAVQFNGRAYISGGSTAACPGNPVNTLYEYNPNEDSLATEIIDNHNRQQPEGFTLYQNYPNPFNPITKIKYQIPERSFVTLKVYDVLGKELATLVNEEKPAGTYKVEFNDNSGEVRNLPAGRQGLPSGFYFYQLRSRDFVETKKMILLR